MPDNSEGKVNHYILFRPRLINRIGLPVGVTVLVQHSVEFTLADKRILKRLVQFVLERGSDPDPGFENIQESADSHQPDPGTHVLNVGATDEEREGDDTEESGQSQESPEEIEQSLPEVAYDESNYCLLFIQISPI